MIRSRAGLALALALVVGLGTTANSIAADQFTIGYLQLKKDPRYSRKRVYARFLGQAHGRPYSGAKVALSEVKFHGAAIGAQFAIERVRAASPGDMVKACRKEVTVFILLTNPTGPALWIDPKQLAEAQFMASANDNDRAAIGQCMN